LLIGVQLDLVEVVMVPALSYQQSTTPEIAGKVIF
jgi:hypothetical protein